jgi:hypothetical protein
MEGRHNGRLGSNDSSILATKREVADRNEGISSHVCTAKEWERSVGSHKVKPRMSTMKDTKCLCRVMWPEVRPKVHADSEQRQNVANLSRFEVLPVVE